MIEDIAYAIAASFLRWCNGPDGYGDHTVEYQAAAEIVRGWRKTHAC